MAESGRLTYKPPLTAPFVTAVVVERTEVGTVGGTNVSFKSHDVYNALLN